MLDFNSTLFIQIINFLVLVILLRIFAYKPVVRILAERRAKIASSIESAENDEAQAKALVEEYKKQLAQARIQAQEIVAKAEKQAQESKDVQIQAVKKEIEELRRNAQADIARERDKAMEQMRAEVVKLSMEAASLIIAKNMDKDTNEELVKDFIGKLDKDKLGDLPC